MKGLFTVKWKIAYIESITSTSCTNPATAETPYFHDLNLMMIYKSINSAAIRMLLIALVLISLPIVAPNSSEAFTASSSSLKSSTILSVTSSRSEAFSALVVLMTAVLPSSPEKMIDSLSPKSLMLLLISAALTLLPISTSSIVPPVKSIP